MDWLDKQLRAAEKHAQKHQRGPTQPIPAPSSGCNSCDKKAWDRAYNFVNMAASLAKFTAQMAIGTKVEQATHDTRASACAACTAVSSTGERLYRKLAEERHSCGIPRWDDLFRDPVADGCGCWLELKWWGVDEKCPRGYW